MLTVTGALFETEVHARRHRFLPTSRQNGMMSRDPGALSMGIRPYRVRDPGPLNFDMLTAYGTPPAPAIG